MAECAMTQEFLNYLKFEKHFSDYTARCYGADLEQFVDFLHGQGTDDHASSGGESYGTWNADSGGVATATKTETKVEELILTADVNLIRRFMTALADKQYCKSTTARKLATLRSFYKFLVKRNYVTANPVTTIKTPKQDKRLPRFLEFEEVQKLLNTPMADNWLGVRDRAILETLYSTGMRVSELVGLNLEDVDFLGEVIHIRGKGKKERIAPIGAKALQSIQQYIEYRNKRMQNDGGFRHQGSVRQQARQTAQHPQRPPQDGQIPAAGRAGPDDQPPYAAAQFRHAHAQQRGRPSQRAGTSRASIVIDNADLYSCDHQQNETSV